MTPNRSSYASGKSPEASTGDRVRVHMTGAEWFSEVPGGLNRYFTDLYNALRVRSDTDVSAAAFGAAEPGGRSWGPHTDSTVASVLTSFRGEMDIPAGTVIDRHYSLFGRPGFGPKGRHPLVAHFQGPWAAESRMAGDSDRSVKIKFQVERVRLFRAEKFIVLSQHSRRLLVEDYRMDDSKIFVIPPGVDLQRFAAPAAETTRTHTVLCVRRLERRMGIDVLLRSWPAVIDAMPDAKLVIVGTGSEEAALRAQVVDLGLSASVVFEGRAPDERLAALYAEAAVSVIPTIALEGFGLIALESCAVGCPPIVTDCGGLPDAVEGLDPSLIVPAGDAAALAHRLTTALGGKVPTVQQCRAYAETFSWQAAADRHLDLYRSLS